MQLQPSNMKEGQRQDSQFAQPLAQYAKREKGQSFQAVNAEDRGKISEQSKQLQVGIQQRRQIENRREDQAKEGPNKQILSKRETLTRSPLAGKAIDQLSENDSPPATQQRKVEEGPKQKKEKTSPNAQSAEESEKDRTERPPTRIKPSEQDAKDTPRPQAKPEPQKEAKDPVPPRPSPKPDRTQKPKAVVQTPEAPEQAKPQQPKNPEPKQQRVAPEKPPSNQASENQRKAAPKAATEQQPRKEEAKKKGADSTERKEKK